MWENASDDVRQTYGREYLDAQIEKQAHGIKGSATSTKPVIDALVDGLMSERPQTRYLVDGGDSFIDKPTVSIDITVLIKTLEFAKSQMFNIIQ